MSTAQPTPSAPPLQKPPGYRDPTTPIHHLPPPPRKAVNLPPSFHPNKRRRRSCCRTFCCCICVLTLILVLLLISFGGFIYLWFQPRLPEFHLKSINFAKFSVSSPPDGLVLLDSQSTIVVEIKNPNQKLGMVYDKIKVSMNAGNGDAVTNLGEQTLAGFSQDKNNVTTLKFAMKVQNEVLDDDDDNKSAEELKNGFRSKNLLVNAEIRSGIGVKGSGWATAVVPVNVLCVGMRLNQVQGGGAMMPKCRIQLLNWIYIN